jgi:hypothetical protein
MANNNMYSNSNYSNSNHSVNDCDWIRTFTGKRFYPLQPRLQDIDIADIAHALSLQCRFTGHCKRHYSVAEHSLIVASLVPEEQQMQALLHDASEAYLTDVPRTLKRLPEYAFYREAEKRLQALIYEYFDCDPEDAPVLKKADVAALGLEAYWLLDVRKGDVWDWCLDEAEARWGALDKCAAGHWLGTRTPAVVEWEFVSQVQIFQARQRVARTPAMEDLEKR